MTKWEPVFLQDWDNGVPLVCLWYHKCHLRAWCCVLTVLQFRYLEVQSVWKASLALVNKLQRSMMSSYKHCLVWRLLSYTIMVPLLTLRKVYLMNLQHTENRTRTSMGVLSYYICTNSLRYTSWIMNSQSIHSLNLTGIFTGINIILFLFKVQSRFI